jgi:hypothetical protein
MTAKTHHWVRFSLLNLSIVAFLGAIMRYKIGFELPVFEQKYLQEAHSHFAFAGWITHTLYFLLVRIFRSGLPRIKELVYQRLILVNLLSAYGMLVCFFIQGYGPVSLAFSTLSVVTGYVFSWYALKDAGRLPADHPARNCIMAAIGFCLLSTLGTMVLSWMMASHHYDQNLYLGSIYFYLHFQYNGWFLFACIGIFMDSIKGFNPDKKVARYSFLLFAIAAIPAYFLSTLWAHLPAWLYVLVVVAAFVQVAGWWFLVKLIRQNLDQLKTAFTKLVLLLLLVVALALSLKLMLQLGSTIPIISKLAFGFRPIVIAYLHLVLLVIISGFLLAFLYGEEMIRPNRTARVGILLFTAGAVLNETVLAVQGIFSFSYTVVPFANEMLFGIALVLMAGATLLLVSQAKPATN